MSAVIAALIGHAEVLDGTECGERRFGALKPYRLAVFFALGIALGSCLHALFADRTSRWAVRERASLGPFPALRRVYFEHEHRRLRGKGFP